MGKLQEIDVVWNEELHLYTIKDWVENAVDDFILENTSVQQQTLDVSTGTFITENIPVEKIESDALYSIMWKKRTILNNRAKEIATKRKQAVAIMVNGFIAYCKMLESKISDASDSITRMLNEYKPKEQKPTKTIYKLVIKTESLDVKKKLEKIALKYGAEVSE